MSEHPHHAAERLSPPPAEQTLSEFWVQFAEVGGVKDAVIRKWSCTPFEGAQRFVLASLTAQQTAPAGASREAVYGALREEADRQGAPGLDVSVMTDAALSLAAAPGRDDRQRRVAEWCAAAFGTDHASSLPQRGVRLLEEAVEAYQAAGGECEMAHKLVDYVFERPAGDLAQELGGVGITLLALSAAAGQSADAEEARELDRVLSKPLAWFAARNKAKNEAGFAVTAAPAPKESDRG